MMDANGKDGIKDGLDVLLSFLKETKQGAYAPIRESDLCFVRLKEVTEYNEFFEEEFYYSVR
ncbi:hypothetical protein DSECCO2_450090 [anaerobic digester metagenome]|jgi:hypothetical protein